MANKISDETIEYVGILAKLELSGQEKEDAKADMHISRGQALSRPKHIANLLTGQENIVCYFH